MGKLLILLLLSVPCWAQQIALPDANVDTTSFTECNGDGDGDWFDELDEGIASADGTATSWSIVASTTTMHIKVGLQNLTDPTSSSGHILRVEAQKGSNCTLAAAGGAGVLVDMDLVEGASTVRASITQYELDGSGFETIEYTLSGAEADSITDYTDLSLDIQITRGAFGASRFGTITAAELQVPAAAGGGGPPASTLITVQ